MEGQKGAWKNRVEWAEGTRPRVTAQSRPWPCHLLTVPPEHSGNGPPALAPPVPWVVVREDAPFVSAECVRLGKANSQCTTLSEKSLKRDKITRPWTLHVRMRNRGCWFTNHLLQLSLFVFSCVSSIAGSDVLVGGGFL